MQRRTFIATAGAGTLSAVAGCLSTGTAPEADENRHAFADSTLSVRIDSRSETNHDVEQIAHEALAFWEEHSRKYVDFGVEFDVVANVDEPDIVIAFADDPSGCEAVEGYSDRVLGCAPLIRPGRRVRRPVTAHVVAGHRPTGKIRITTKHELGHIFGLDHDDEPRWIMSNRPADRIPLYETRIEIWETVLEAWERGRDGNEQFNEGSRAWRNGEYETGDDRFSAAHQSYGEMRELLATAQERTAEFEGHERVETVNLSRLRALLDRLSRRASAAEWFSFHMGAAARHALAGDGPAVDESLAEANDWIREYNDIGRTELRDISIALGLVRGFDRTETVVEGEGEELDSEDTGA